MAHWNQESRFPAAASRGRMSRVFLSQVLSMYTGGKAPSSIQPKLHIGVICDAAVLGHQIIVTKPHLWAASRAGPAGEHRTRNAV